MKWRAAGQSEETESSATSAAPAPKPGAPKIGELLVGQGVLTPAQLGEALLQQTASGRKLGVLLVELGTVDERQVIEALGRQLDLPVVDFRHVEPDPEVVKAFPEATARSLTAMPLRREGEKLQVVVSDPLDKTLLPQLNRATKGRITLLLAPEADIRRAIDNSYRAMSGVDRLVEVFQASEGGRKPEAAVKSQAGDDAPVVRVAKLIFTQALRDRASDIHVEPQSDRVRIRFRIDGALHDVQVLPESMGTALVSRIKVMAGMNIVEKRRPQDGQISTDVDGRAVDIRVNTSPTIWGEKAVLRVLDRDRSLHRLEDLGMPSDTQQAYSQLVRSPFGMVACCGPTGSGKTTTLYATIAQINNSDRNVTTIEDPVEYQFPGINQIQIHDQAGITFASGLRSILRQDPDIILVGEMRDEETARIAVQAALTGHFVLSSIHSTDSCSALHRFVDMGIEPFLIASALVGIVSQRLVRRTCEHCRVPYTPSVEEVAFYEEAGGPAKEKFWQGEGCNFCSQTGYQGRIGVYELLRLTDQVKELLVAKASVQQLRAVASAGGMRSLLQEGVALVAEDVTTVAEIMRTIYTL